MVLLATALGLALTGSLLFFQQINSVYTTTLDGVQDEIEDLRNIASGRSQADGTLEDPSGSDLPEDTEARTFATVEELLFEVLRSDAPSPSENFAAFIDGRMVYVPVQTDEHRIDVEDPFLVEMALSLADPTAGTIHRKTLANDQEVLLTMQPVTVEGDDSQGYLLVVRDLSRGYVEVWQNTWMFIGISLFTLLLVGILGYSVMFRLMRPLERITRVAETANTTDLGARAELIGTGDEIDRLGQAFNAMMDRVEDGITEQRRFMSDLSHELRTPITIVRGNLEVMDETDPEDVCETRKLTLGEIDRMNRMVDDLSLLAKARRSDFVQPAATSTARIVSEVVTKAEALGPQTVEAGTSVDQAIVVDAQRIVQALLQLCKNAATYTPDDSRIEISALTVSGLADRPELGRAVLFRVVDDGPGIAEEDQAHLFDRFHRGRAARNKDGTGLGLSIVQAIAQAHGGWAELESEPGHGAAFTVVVPAEPPAEFPEAPDLVPEVVDIVPETAELPRVPDGTQVPLDGTRNDDASEGTTSPKEGTPWRTS